MVIKMLTISLPWPRFQQRPAMAFQFPLFLNKELVS
jgi:hypothetical protein